MARKLARLRGALAAALSCVAILACVLARIRTSLLVPPSGQVLAQGTAAKKCPDDPSLCARKPSGMSEKEFQKQLKLRKAIMKTEVRLRDHVGHAPSRPPSPPHAHSQSCTQACSGNCRRSPHCVWRQCSMLTACLRPQIWPATASCLQVMQAQKRFRTLFMSSEVRKRDRVLACQKLPSKEQYLRCYHRQVNWCATSCAAPCVCMM